MKRLAALFAVVLALPLAGAAQTTTVTASNERMGGAPISVGTASFTAISAAKTAIPFTDAAGNGNGPEAFQCQIAAGVITGTLNPDGTLGGACTVPDSTLTTPPVQYMVQVCDTSVDLSTSQQCFQEGPATISGATWQLDHFSPANTVPLPSALTLTTAVSPPPASCTAPAEYRYVNNGAVTAYTCYGGVFIAYGGGGGTSSPATSTAIGGVQLASGVNSNILSKVASSGSYSDLLNQPTIPAAPTGATPMIQGLVYLPSGQNSNTLAKVAITGNYSDLSGAPTGNSASAATAAALGTVQLPTGQTSDVLAKVAITGNYSDLSGAPTGGPASAATATALGTVQLPSGQTSDVLAKPAITGSFTDLSQNGTTQGRVIYQCNSWTSGSTLLCATGDTQGMTVDSANVTAGVNSNGKITLTGTAANLNGYIALNATQAADEDVDLDVVLTVGAAAGAANNFGISVGKVSTNNDVQPDLAGFLALDDVPADLKWIEGSGTTVSTFSSLSPVGTVAAGDVIELVYSQRGNVFTVTFYDHTQQTYATNVVTSAMAPNGQGNYNINPPNSSKLAIWTQGGSYTIQSITATSRQPYAPNLCIVGHSYVWGFNAGLFSQRFASLLAAKYGNVAVYGGQADKMSEMLGDAPYVAANHCAQILLVGGYNDLAFNVPTATWEAQYQQTVTALQANGAKVYHLELANTPNQSQITTVLNPFISATFPAANIISAPSFEISSDNTHPDGPGHSTIAADIDASGVIQPAATATLAAAPLASTLQYSPGSYAVEGGTSAAASTIPEGYAPFMECTANCTIDTVSQVVFVNGNGLTITLPIPTPAASATNGAQRQVTVYCFPFETNGCTVAPPSGYTLYALGSTGSTVASILLSAGQSASFSANAYSTTTTNYLETSASQAGTSTPAVAGVGLVYQHCGAAACTGSALSAGETLFADLDYSSSITYTLPAGIANSTTATVQVTARCFVFTPSCVVQPPSGWSMYLLGSTGSSSANVTVATGHTITFTQFAAGGNNWVQSGAN